MCGIYGIINSDSSKPVDRMVLERMNNVIKHRGPDSDGFHLKNNIALGIRRLAINDLSTGDQPISNENKTVWVVFNGEIYNYPELRLELEDKGHIFRSKCDTETIVHLYEDFGVDCVNHLRGMFAFALWDERKRELLIVRDRLGQKPLYYTYFNGTLIFGSELKCILQYPSIPREINLEAIHHFLTLQYVPDPLSAFKDIYKLPPAHRLLWKDGCVRVEPYWDLKYEPKWDLPEHDIKQKLRKTITEAVSIRLMSDVPFGAHLSGGIDSTIIVGLMAKMVDHPIKTFSIGFEEEAFSELPYARQVSKKFNTDHHEFILKPETMDILPKLVEHFDEPFADPAAMPTWYLSQMTRQYVTVALNGDGGDEAFAGYQRYYGDTIADIYRMVPEALRKNIFDKILQSLPTQADKPTERSYIAALRQLSQAANLSHAASIIRWGYYFNEADKSDLYTNDMHNAVKNTLTSTLLEDTFKKANALNRLDRTLYTDIHNYLPGALLPKVDRTTMAHSLEARSPFLDHKVMELAARLPIKWKVKGFQTKIILKELFNDLLPENIQKRGKIGFGLPLGMWFRDSLYQNVNEILLASDSRLHKYFRREVITRLIEDNKRCSKDNGKRIWTLLNFEIWLRQYKAVT